MSTLKIPLYSCFIIQLFSCRSPQEDKITESRLLEHDLAVIQSDLLHQEAIMDSINSVEEIELAQQIVLKQQLIDLKAKLAGEEARLNAGLVSSSSKITGQKP